MKWLDVEKNKRFPVPSCGKSDFRDILIMHQADGTDASVDAFLAKTDIYIGRAGPLRLDHFEDCIPYLHHLVSVASFNTARERNYVCLTKDSYIDSAEKESVEHKIECIETYKSSDVINKSFKKFASGIGLPDGCFDKNKNFDNYMLKKYYDTPFNKYYYITSRATHLRAQLLLYALDNDVDICNHSELAHQLTRFLYYYIHTSKLGDTELLQLTNGLKEGNRNDITKLRDLMEKVL